MMYTYGKEKEIFVVKLTKEKYIAACCQVTLPHSLASSGNGNLLKFLCMKGSKGSDTEAAVSQVAGA